jgi:hypothetical protein
MEAPARDHCGRLRKPCGTGACGRIIFKIIDERLKTIWRK